MTERTSTEPRKRHSLADLYHERTNYQFIAHSRRWLLISGALPRGKTAGPYGTQWPAALLVDDDPIALEHLELLLSSRFPDLEIIINARTVIVAILVGLGVTIVAAVTTG